MNNRFYPIALGLIVLLSISVGGCASQKQAQTQPKTQSQPGSGKGRYVTLPPETGSRMPRRVWVAEDGSVDKASQVERAGAGGLGDLQQKSNVNIKGGN